MAALKDLSLDEMTATAATAISSATRTTTTDAATKPTTATLVQKGDVPVTAQDPSMLINNNNNSVLPQYHHHWSNVAFLDLFDWELASLVGISSSVSRRPLAEASCQPPSGIPARCCIGTVAGRERKNRPECRGKTLQQYHSMRDDVLLQLQKQEQAATTTRSTPTDHPQTMSCDLCRIMSLAYEHNLTFGIHGDSMTRQFLNVLECSLLRRGYQVNVTRSHPPLENHIFIIDSVEWNRSVTIYGYMQYVVPTNVSHPDMPGNNPHVNVLLTAFGLHWSLGSRRHPADKYRIALERLYEHLFLLTNNKNNNIRLLLHRETSAQHFDGDAGDYFLAQNSTNNTLCVPMDRRETAGWRESVVKQVATSKGYQVVLAEDYSPTTTALQSDDYHSSRENNNLTLVVLPFFNTSSEWHELHPYLPKSNSHMDCTHFCQSPYLFWPLWRSLRIAVERTVIAG